MARKATEQARRATVSRTRRGGGKKKEARRPARPPKDAVDRDSWLIFLDLHLKLGGETGRERLTFDGWLVSESDRRAIHRWKEEGSTPTWYGVDAFLVRHGMTLTDFEIWAEWEGRPAMAYPEEVLSGAA